MPLLANGQPLARIQTPTPAQLTDNTKQSYAVEEPCASKECDAMKFAEKLRALRRARQISQRALAMAVGVDHTYLRKSETVESDDSPSSSAH